MLAPSGAKLFFVKRLADVMKMFRFTLAFLSLSGSLRLLRVSL